MNRQLIHSGIYTESKGVAKHTSHMDKSGCATDQHPWRN